MGLAEGHIQGELVSQQYREELTRRARLSQSREPDDSGAVVAEIHDEVRTIRMNGPREIFRLPGAWQDKPGDFVVKLVGGMQSDGMENPGLIQNCREILIGHDEVMQGVIVPVVDYHPEGLWVVMASADQYDVLEWDTNYIERTVEKIKTIEYLKPVPMHPGSGLDLYWTANWGMRQGRLRLLDYGGIAVSPQLAQHEPRLDFRDPAAVGQGTNHRNSMDDLTTQGS